MTVGDAAWAVGTPDCEAKQQVRLLRLDAVERLDARADDAARQRGHELWRATEEATDPSAWDTPRDAIDEATSRVLGSELRKGGEA